MSDTCACGCGGTPRQGRKFIHGHYSRTPEAQAGYKARRKPIEPPNPSGLCMCGCGQPTPLATRNRPSRGEMESQHLRYIVGHQARLQTGPNSPHWKGGRWTHKGGYVYLYVPDHPAANRDGYVYEHRVIAEQKIGRPLEPQERVHHVNGIKTDNRPENLVVLRDQSAHKHMEGNDELRRYYAKHPEARSEHGRKGAAVRWAKDETQE